MAMLDSSHHETPAHGQQKQQDKQSSNGGKRYEYRGATPENREPDIQTLLSSFITPVERVYDRNHSEYPTTSAEATTAHDTDANAAASVEDHVVRVGGDLLAGGEVLVSMVDLRGLPQHEVLCCLQCAGNRRHTMRTKLREVSGIDWFDGAVANCQFRGPRLRDVLLQCVGIDKLPGLKTAQGQWKGHVECLSRVKPCEDAEVYGGSVALERAMDLEGDCILALEMNGQPLNLKHGAPLRAIFPGILGARSVKWLTHINLLSRESQNHYQQRDYKVLPSAATDAATAEHYWSSTPAMNDMPVNSTIGVPGSGAVVGLGDDGCVEVRGYALPAGQDGPVVRVEVSGDGGETWVDAELDFGGEDAPGLHTAEGRRRVRWAWALWVARVRVAPGSGRRIVSRATDWTGNTQPREGRWTLRGVGYNAWGEVDDLTVVEPKAVPSEIVVGDGLKTLAS